MKGLSDITRTVADGFSERQRERDRKRQERREKYPWRKYVAQRLPIQRPSEPSLGERRMDGKA